MWCHLAASIEIICVGNELLIGKTLNTNAHWLAKRVTSLGMSARRIIVVGDDVNEISDVILEAIQRNPDFILTSGGLGPTFDDVTLEGLAKGLGRRLQKNDEALRMVREKYRKYVEEGRMKRVELTPPRVKMAKLPQGGEPLPNPVGTAPGVVVSTDNLTIIALPGVPSEMKAIFDESALPILKKAAGDTIFFETSIEATGVMESELAPSIARAMHDNPYVYIKSHPKGEERIHRIEFHLSTMAKNAIIARERVGKALLQLSETIVERGGRVNPAKAKS